MSQSPAWNHHTTWSKGLAALRGGCETVERALPSRKRGGVAEGTDPAGQVCQADEGLWRVHLSGLAHRVRPRSILQGSSSMYFLSSKTRLITGLRTSCR